MRRNLFIWFLFIQHLVFSQTDYSSNWEDFFSYSNVSDLIQNDQKIIALSDNALFVYDKTSQIIEKISSVNGLSGDEASAIYYDETSGRIVIGYNTGLLEIIDANRKIYKKPDIVNFSILGSKTIQNITPNGTDLYLSTPFGIVVFDLATLNFKNTYFIGNGSTEVHINDITFFNGKIIAVTKTGLYVADLNNAFLIDFNNWTKYHSNDFTAVSVFNNNIYISISNDLYRLNTDYSLSFILSHTEPILDLKTNSNLLTLSSIRQVRVFDVFFNVLQSVSTQVSDTHYFSANSAQTYQNQLYIATKEFGILRSDFNRITNYVEIHPQGPLDNKPFAISVLKNHLWVVYGMYDPAYTPQVNQKGISHFNGTDWVNLPFKSDGVNYRDLVHVSIDPNHANKVFVSSYSDGMLIIQDDVVTTRWNHLNSGLEKLDYPLDPNYISIRIGGSVFDDSGNLWIANSIVANRLKKYSPSGQWTNFNLSSLISNPALGLNEIIIDKSGNKWIGTRRNGALVVNENGTKIMSFITQENKGDLPDLNVRCMAVDKSNRVWIGTRAGLRYFNSSTSMFDLTTYKAKTVVIDYGQDDGYGEALMGNQSINSICIDGADNKWFGTDGAGVLCTNSSGLKTLYQFNKTNSPLPSNRILKIVFDGTTGKIYFASDKGIVAFNSRIAPYGDSLQEIYAYPNPVKKNHEFVTIAGRNGSNIPYGTNVKILDAAGKLVYETNVEEGQEAFGGKVVWNKTNLAGTKVASGIYVVLMYFKDEAETAITKIAIVN